MYTWIDINGVALLPVSSAAADSIEGDVCFQTPTQYLMPSPRLLFPCWRHIVGSIEVFVSHGA